MSITRCPICDSVYDQDFDVEHEENCQERDVIAPTDQQLAKIYFSTKNTDLQPLVAKLRPDYLDKYTASDIIKHLDRDEYKLAKVRIQWVLDDHIGDVADINLANESR